VRTIIETVNCERKGWFMRRSTPLMACMMVGAVLLAGSSAKAKVTLVPLLSIANTSALFAKTYRLPFTATETSTTISFQGYNMSDFEYVDPISVTSAGGANLLGSTWTKTPAASGSYAYQSSQLEFGAVSGEPDTFFQTFQTTPKAQYVLTFDFAASGFALFNLSSFPPDAISLLSGPVESNSLEVFASGSAPVSAPSVPEPSTWAMMLLGFAGLGSVRYRWRGRSIAHGRQSRGSFR
jgi:PEP-CTERM motif